MGMVAILRKGLGVGLPVILCTGCVAKYSAPIPQGSQALAEVRVFANHFHTTGWFVSSTGSCSGSQVIGAVNRNSLGKAISDAPPKLGMPKVTGQFLSDESFAEIAVVPDRKNIITANVVVGTSFCHFSAAFVPESGGKYEIASIYDRGRCGLRVFKLEQQSANGWARVEDSSATVQRPACKP